MKDNLPRDAKDYGTPELHKQMDVRIKNGLARVYKRLPLDDYRDRESPIITEEQWFAGNRLNYLFQISGLFTVNVSRYTDEKGIFHHDGEISTAESCEREYRHALKNMSWDCRRVTLNVCCYHMDIERSAKLMSKFKQGLHQLHDIFRNYER